MIRLELIGVLAERFGSVYELEAKTPREAVMAVAAMVEDFYEYLRHHDFVMWVDEKNIAEDDVAFDYGNCTVKMGLHISGSGGNGGLFAIIAGIALIVVGWWNPLAWGASAQMLAIGSGCWYRGFWGSTATHAYPLMSRSLTRTGTEPLTALIILSQQ